MKLHFLFFWFLILFVACGQTTKPESPLQETEQKETEQKAKEKQSRIFETKLKDPQIGEVEKAYLHFRLYIEGKIPQLSIHPSLASSFSNEFVHSLWDPNAYRNAYLSYLTLTNIFTNENIDRGFLLGRAAIAAFKAKQYKLFLQMLRESFEIQVTDETLYYYGLWYWYIQKDKVKAKEILSRLRPERLGISSTQWNRFLSEDVAEIPSQKDSLALLRSVNPSDQVKGFQLWLSEYEKNGKPFWKYEAFIPLYVPTNISLGYYLNPMNNLFPRMTRDWPLPYSIRPGKPGQNRYVLFLEEPWEKESFLLLYAQPADFPWKSGYRGIEPPLPRVAYTNAFLAYVQPQKETEKRITNVTIQTIPLPIKYFLSCNKIYREGKWQYAIVGFRDPNRLEVVIFNPSSQKMSKITVSLQEVNTIYYIPFPLSNQWTWIGTGKHLSFLEEIPLTRKP